MRKCVLLLFSILVGHFSHASPPQKHSIFVHLLRETKDCASYRELIILYDFATSEKYDEVLRLSNKIYSTVGSNSKCKDFIFFLRGLAFKEKTIFKKAKQEFQQVKNKALYATAISNLLGQIALSENQFKTAIRYFKSIENQNDLRYCNTGLFYNNLGIAYLHLQRYDLSEKYLLKAVPFYEKNQDSTELITSYINLANLYYEQYKDDIAIHYFQKSYELAKYVNDFQLKWATAKNMAVVEENRKNFIKALEYRKEIEVWSDSLNDQNKVWEIAELEKKFALRNKQRKIDLLAAENRIKQTERNTFILVSFLLLILLLSGVYFYRQKVKSTKIIADKNEELDRLNATKDKLFSIVSHDLRSSVNALKNSNQKVLKKLEQNDFEEIDRLLQRNANITNSSYNLLDNLLHWAQQQTGQLYFQQETLNLSKVVEQVAYNFKYLLEEKNISFCCEIPNNLLVDMDLDSLKIILRNLFDNAIKYNHENGEINISAEIREEDAFVTLFFSDKGKGMSSEKIAELMSDSVLLSKKDHHEIVGTGLGFQLCKSMLQKNGGRIERIESELNKGVEFVILLPKAKK